MDDGELKTVDSKSLYSEVNTGDLVDLIYEYGTKKNKVTGTIKDYSKLIEKRLEIDV